MKLFRRKSDNARSATPMTGSWRVQAVLLPSVTKGDEYRYSPQIVHSQAAVDEAVSELYASFGPGMIRVDVTQES